MYLKCPHCNYLNPITGPYQTFCQNCNKKLENNFSDWHKRNPDKSFEDFKVLFGQGEIPLQSPKKSKRKSRFFEKDKSGKTKVLWGALIGFVVMIAVITVTSNFGSQIVESFLFDKTSKVLLSNPWQEVTPGNAGLSFLTPVKLNDFDLGITTQLKKRFEYIKSYSSDKNQPLQIVVNIMKVKPPLKARLKKDAEGAVSGMMAQRDVSEFTYTDKPAIISNIPAIIQTGSYLWQNTDHINFRDIIITRERTLWQITIMYKSDDASGSEVADSILHTVSIQ